MIEILYSSGSHGKFLELLLNLFSGTKIKVNPITETVHTYDRIKYEQPAIFRAIHDISYSSPDCNKLINIRVRPQSYMKYIAVCFNRTAGVNIILEELDKDTFNKIRLHTIFSSFLTPLQTISGLDSGDVEIKYLREWARLCFFDNTFDVVEQFTKTAVYLAPDYVIDFECFYNDNKLLTQCKLILEKFNVPMVPIENIHDYLIPFTQNNRYRNIDIDLKLITQAIINKQDYRFNSENFIKQAWIDNWLKLHYNVDIKLQNEYWHSTKEIIKVYNL